MCLCELSLLRVGMMRASNDMVVVLVMTYGSLTQMLWMGVSGHTYIRYSVSCLAIHLFGGLRQPDEHDGGSNASC
jgi:hypothetical protein